MSIIRCSNLDERSIASLENLFAKENTTPEETLQWLRIWKLWGKVTPHLARFGCVFKTVEFAEKSAHLSQSLISLSNAKALFEEAKSSNIEILTPNKKNYPNNLREIFDFPLVLYAKGNLELLQKPMFAVVGSRSASAEALQISYNFSKEISKNDIVIVSGFANGIDTSACKGAMENGTVQVLGSGINCPYPAQNVGLMKEVLQKGGVFLSEFPPSFPARPSNFPTRNRIITGLSHGVLIGQANRKNGVSGTLVTLRIANSQGKEIFAYPGSILDKRCKICNDLLKTGTAHFATSTKDILEILNPIIYSPKKIPLQNFEKESKIQQLFEDIIEIENTKPTQEDLEESLQRVLNAISTTPCCVNDIALASKTEIEAVQECLSELEILGKIVVNASGKYSRSLL